MKRRSFQRITKKILICAWIAAGIYFTPLAGITEAEDGPTFRQGMWEFNRTVENIGSPGKPQTITTKKCTNPTEDMKKQNEMVSKIGCKSSPLVKNGKTYSFTTECKIQGVTAQSTSVITVENDSAYNIKIKSQSGGQGTNETLQARRTGDCTK
jgi:hypothetical protein